MKEELTGAMHSEFEVDAETEIKHKAFCVWYQLKPDASHDQVKKIAESYLITLEDALKWKDHFFGLIEKR
jgi:hypothetical protein